MYHPQYSDCGLLSVVGWRFVWVWVYGSIVKRISHFPPKEKTQVRVLLGLLWHLV
jgi:hypothetical protein